MSASLLVTKLHWPAAPSRLVQRPRLVQRLNDCFLSDCPLILISAPAGYGKTTLMSEWHASTGRDYPLAWVTLDKDDNDPVRFLNYFVTALKVVKPGLGENILTTLQAPRSPDFPSFLTSLINELDEFAKPFALALDDYHVVEDRSVHEALIFLLDHLPPQMHLVILSRADPPFPLSRLRARHQLTEIRSADLRFSGDEAFNFLNQANGLALSEDQVAALEQRTEGWIAGLQLAALSIKGRDDIPGFVSSFTGSHHYIVDYLVEEVLNRQPPELTDFLLRTSFLDRLCGALCDTVTGGSGGQSWLEKLEHANLFVVSLDNEQYWYRYHHLFAEVLQKRLQQASPEIIPQLHRRAAGWFEHNELMPEAVEHALAGGDFEGAALLAELCVPQMLKHGEIKTLFKWLASLPEEVVRTRPRLCISYAWSLAFSIGAPETAERYLQYAEEAVQADTSLADAQDLLGQTASIRAAIAVSLGDNGRAVELCAQALEKISDSNTALRGTTALTQADASWTMGDGITAQRALKEAVRYSRMAGDMQTAMTSMNYQARVLVAHGLLKQAFEVYQAALSLAAGWRAQNWPAMGVIEVGLGILSWEQNDAEAAIRYLTEGIDLAAQAHNNDSLLFGYSTLARIYQAKGEMDQALEMIQKAERIVLDTQLARDRYRVAVRQTGLMLAKGDIPGAARWSQELTDSVEEYSRRSSLLPLSPLRVSEQLMHARVLIAQQHPREAMQRLSPLLGPLEAAGRTRSVIEVFTLQAIASHAESNESQAMTALLRALSLAEPEGFVRLFVDEGKPMAQLLLKIKSEGRELREYIHKLLAAFELAEPKPAPSSPQPGTPAGQLFYETLSPREVEVLRLIAAGYSNKDIAHRLVIALGTVKRHTANIFDKLGAYNRTEAVAKARELGLL